MKILLFGGRGQVGWELQRALPPLGELVVLNSDSTPLIGDFENPEALAQSVHAVRPDVIVNAAAYTAVDKAETERDAARTINASAPGVLAKAAADLGAWLVHYSTDYVFDGSGTTPWLESDKPNPLSVYGSTKLEGEELIRASGCRHFIFRTSWVYAARGHNFVRTILRLARERDRLTIIDDQIGAPTGAELLADVTAHSIRTAQSNSDVGGTYHLVADGYTSWHGYAKHIVEFASALGQTFKVAPSSIEPIPTTAFPTPAKRPANSRLDTEKLRATLGLALPPWQLGVNRMLAELLEGR